MRMCYYASVGQNKTRKELKSMNMSESSRLILGLRSKGWTDTEIADFILWIETGEVQYKPDGDDK